MERQRVTGAVHLLQGVRPGDARAFSLSARKAAARGLGLSLAALFAPDAAAQEASRGLGDSIVVTASPDTGRVLPDQDVLDARALDEIQPLAVADMVRGMAAISLRQNSRGETVVRIRSGEERQTPVFLDGAPLATPWDGRIDLGILPAGIIGEVGVIRSAAPIEFGANAIAGVIDLRTTTGSDEAHGFVSARTGSGRLVDLGGLVSVPVGAGEHLVLAATHRDSAFTTISQRGAIPFDPSRDDRRTNTDQRTDSVFAAIGHDGGAVQLRASLLHVDAERGIPAEGHLDPATESPRYWRYPLWRLTQATLNMAADLGGSLTLRGVAWHQWFAQDIDAYSDDSYARIVEREGGRDRTMGARLTLSGGLGGAQWRVSASALSSTHGLINSVTASGDAAGLETVGRERFRHEFLSGGGELDLPLGPGLDLTAGAGVDASFTPLTGDKPAQPGKAAPSLSAILAWQPLATLRMKASLAQRTRFATLREQFGQALNRFYPNLGLKPERMRTAELSASWQGRGRLESLRGEFSAWLADGRDTLGQRVVVVAGKRLRQRYNMRGSLTHGFEATLNARLATGLTAEFSSAFQGGHPRSEPDNPAVELVQQVEERLTAALDWQASPRLDLRAEYQRHGKAWDLDENGAYVRLPGADVVTLRAFWRLGAATDRAQLLASLSVDNVTDALVLPQLGLPAPGRTVMAGLKWQL